MEFNQQLTPKLKQLRRSGSLPHWRLATGGLSTRSGAYAEFLERILEDEIEGPAQKQLTLWVRRAAGRNVRSCSGFVDFLEHP